MPISLQELIELCVSLNEDFLFPFWIQNSKCQWSEKFSHILTTNSKFTLKLLPFGLAVTNLLKSEITLLVNDKWVRWWVGTPQNYKRTHVKIFANVERERERVKLIVKLILKANSWYLSRTCIPWTWKTSQTNELSYLLNIIGNRG